MKAEKLQIKIFTDSAGAPIPVANFIPVFHGWIKRHALDDLLIDVANYAHVPHGPGVGVIGHGSDYFMDSTGQRLGLLYSRKRQAPPAAERLGDAFRRTLRAAQMLEADVTFGGKLRFRTDEYLFRINDRLLAPNSDDTLAALRPELESFGERLFGAPATIERAGDARELFTLRIRASSRPTLPALLERLSG